MSLERTRKDWDVLGDQDPLWAVLVTPEGRNQGWDPAAFLATGRTEIDALLQRVAAAGLTPGRARALDFGSGAGRLAQALAQHFEAVTGVDVSAPMIARARQLDTEGRVDFVLNDRDDLSLFDDGTFDLVNSALVLQHIPPPHNRLFLAELVRVVRPGGVVAVQVATAPDRSPRGLLTRILPTRAMRLLQQRVLRYPAPMEMHPLSDADVDAAAARHGGVVRASWEDEMYGGHWRYTRYLIEKPA